MSNLRDHIAPACLAAGLTEKPGPAWVRHFSGNVHGREVDVTCSPRTRTRYSGEIRRTSYDGDSFMICMSTDLSTRLAMAKASRSNPVGNALHRKLGLKKLGAMPPSLAHQEAWASEPSWLEVKTQDLDVANLLGYLLPDVGAQAAASLALSPDGLIFGVRTGAFAPEQVGYWIASVARLVAALEAGSRPALVYTPQRWETFVKDRPAIAILVFLAGFFVVAFTLCALLVVLAVLMAR